MTTNYHRDARLHIRQVRAMTLARKAMFVGKGTWSVREIEEIVLCMLILANCRYIDEMLSTWQTSNEPEDTDTPF